MIEELEEERKKLKNAIDYLSNEDVHIGVYYQGYVGNYMNDNMTDYLKDNLDKAKKYVIENLNKRILEINNTIDELLELQNKMKYIKTNRFKNSLNDKIKQLTTDECIADDASYKESFQRIFDSLVSGMKENGCNINSCNVSNVEISNDNKTATLELLISLD